MHSHSAKVYDCGCIRSIRYYTARASANFYCTLWMGSITPGATLPSCLARFIVHEAGPLALSHLWVQIPYGGRHASCPFSLEIHGAAVSASNPRLTEVDGIAEEAAEAVECCALQPAAGAARLKGVRVKGLPVAQEAQYPVADTLAKVERGAGVGFARLRSAAREQGRVLTG